MAPACSKAPDGLTIDRVYALQPSEGVFAYARISPDGGYLVYTSERPVAGGSNGSAQTLTVVNLTTRTIEFSEPGLDGYWSNDGRRSIYLSTVTGAPQVAIRHQDSGAVSRGIAPAALGGYLSWGVQGGRDLILTILGNYYYLNGDLAELPAAQIPACQDGRARQRPLISKDGRRITTFIDGMIVVRNLVDCGDMINTGLRGAKADFSWDGRFIAFHAPKTTSTRKEHEITVVDLARMTVRRLDSLPGSSYYPSWTQDGRLCFRYDGPDYRGFVIARNVLSLPEAPLSPAPADALGRTAWSDVFPETPVPQTPLTLVLIWAPWNAHSPEALLAARKLARSSIGADRLAVAAAPEPTSMPEETDRMFNQYGSGLRRIPLAVSRLRFTGAVNQIPTVLLFRGAVLVDQKLGAQSADELLEWVTSFISE